MFTETAVIIGISAITLPYIILVMQSVFEGIDTRLDDAAASMGASPRTAFWRIIFPLAMPGVLIAAALCFILSMNTFPTAVLLGGPRFQMMSPLLFYAFATENNWPFAAAIAFILMAATLVLTGLAHIAIPRRYRPS
jgi:putative spermidine/putrescine transport system permease protein